MKIPNDCLLGNCKNYTRLLLPIFIKTFYRIGTKNIVVAYFKIHYAYLNTEFSACSSFTLLLCLCDIYGWMDLSLSLTVKNMLRYSLSILAQYKLKNGSIKRTNSVASCEKILFRWSKKLSLPHELNSTVLTRWAFAYEVIYEVIIIHIYSYCVFISETWFSLHYSNTCK